MFAAVDMTRCSLIRYNNLKIDQTHLNVRVDFSLERHQFQLEMLLLSGKSGSTSLYLITLFGQISWNRDELQYICDDSLRLF